MPKYRIVLSYDVQKAFEVNAKDEDTATDKAKDWTNDLGIDDWEYRDLIEIKEINVQSNTKKQIQREKDRSKHSS